MMKRNRHLHLEATNGYLAASPEKRAEVCNGVGPASWPKEARALLDSPWLTLGVSFRPAALPHDWEYTYGTTEQDKVNADRRFRRNCRAIVFHYTSWWQWKLLLKRLALANALYLAVKYGGDKAFWAGKERPSDSTS